MRCGECHAPLTSRRLQSGRTYVEPCGCADVAPIGTYVIVGGQLLGPFDSYPDARELRRMVDSDTPGR